MAHIEWTDAFSVGVPTLDDQHRQLVEIVNKFEEALQRGKGSRQVTAILNDLLGYTQEHFATEERLLAAAGYPQLKLHQSQHRQLLQKIERFQYEYGAGRRITAELHEFLTYWLVNHIQRDDRAYVAALVPQGATEGER